MRGDAGATPVMLPAAAIDSTGNEVAESTTTRKKVLDEMRGNGSARFTASSWAAARHGDSGGCPAWPIPTSALPHLLKAFTRSEVEPEYTTEVTPSPFFRLTSIYSTGKVPAAIVGIQSSNQVLVPARGSSTLG